MNYEIFDEDLFEMENPKDFGNPNLSRLIASKFR